MMSSTILNQSSKMQPQEERKNISLGLPSPVMSLWQWPVRDVWRVLGYNHLTVGTGLVSPRLQPYFYWKFTGS